MVRQQISKALMEPESVKWSTYLAAALARGISPHKARILWRRAKIARIKEESK